MTITTLKQTIRKVVSALAAGTLAIGVFAADAPIGTAAYADTSFESAATAVDGMKLGWNLGNTLDSYGEWIELYTDGSTDKYETAWGNPVATQSLIAAVKSEGYGAVRVPVTWAQHIDSNGSIDEDWLDRVQEVVDYVVSQGLYCVLNVHHDGGTDGWIEASAECYEENKGKFAGLWKNIAVRFRNYGEKLIFESFNEVLDKDDSWTQSSYDEAYEAINSFNQLFVDTVRATGGNNAVRNLMVQTYSGAASTKTLNAFVLPSDSTSGHLIVQVHNYDPQGFTSSTATWTTMTDAWGSDSEKEYMDDLFQTLGNFSKKIGAPVVLGEFGAEYKYNDAERAEYAGYVIGAAAEQGIACFWWDVGEMALIDRTTETASHPLVIAAMLAAAGIDTSADDTQAVSIGDANADGSINALDAALVLQYVVGAAQLSDSSAADANADGSVNTLDAALILQWAVG